MRTVNYDEWEAFSLRRNSVNYKNHDESRILKTSGPECFLELEELIKEKETSDKVRALGIRTPKVLEIVDDGNGGYGMISEYVKGKKSIARIVSEDPENIADYAKKYADFLKNMHSVKCEENLFENLTDKVRPFFENSPLFTAEQRRKCLKLMDITENTHTCLHGDCQHGNFVLAYGEVSAIDLNFFSVGNPLYDIGVFYFFMKVMPERVIFGLFHTTRDICDKFWDLFIREYLGTTDAKIISDYEEKLEAYGFVGLGQHTAKLENPREYIDALNRDFEKAFAWVE